MHVRARESARARVCVWYNTSDGSRDRRMVDVAKFLSNPVGDDGFQDLIYVHITSPIFFVSVHGTILVELYNIAYALDHVYNYDSFIAQGFLLVSNPPLALDDLHLNHTFKSSVISRRSIHQACSRSSRVYYRGYPRNSDRSCPT